MRKIGTKRARIIVASSLALAVVGGGAAYAYWTTTGTGSGTAGTTGGQNNVLSFTQNGVSSMYPGDAEQALTVAVKNTSGENVYVSSVRAYVTVAASGVCSADDYLLNGAAAPGTAATAASLAWTAADLAPNATANATGSIQFNNKADVNQDGCKNAVVTVHYLGS